VLYVYFWASLHMPFSLHFMAPLPKSMLLLALRPSPMKVGPMWRPIDIATSSNRLQLRNAVELQSVKQLTTVACGAVAAAAVAVHYILHHRDPQRKCVFPSLT